MIYRENFDSRYQTRYIHRNNISAGGWASGGGERGYLA
jgi:hypothetical protein